MPRYFFDCVEGQSRHYDQYGIDLVDKQEAADHAICLAGTMMSENASSEGVRVVAVLVRTTDDRVVYVAHGTLHGCMTPDGI